MHNKAQLCISNLSIHAKGRPLVRDVSFDVGKGEIVCVVGESGSGKTLTALSVMGLLPPGVCAQGQIVFEGHDVSALSARQWQNLRGVKMGMIFQEPMTSLNPVIGVGRQVAEVFEAHTDLLQLEIKRKVVELFEKVKIDRPEERYNAYPHQLSGGQRQRVMIAMALALGPDLLVADEPTTALDATVQNRILSLLKELIKEFNLSVLFITHDFGVVREIADRVIVMKDGNIVEQGNVGDVMHKPKAAYTQSLLDAMPHLHVEARHASKQLSAPMLQVQGVSKAFAPKRRLWGGGETLYALNNVSFELHEKETVGLVGESGCGKSTLAKCLVGLLQPDSGHVYWDGQDIAEAKGKHLKSVRRDIQMVFQDPFSSLNPRLTVGESVGEGLRAHGTFNARQREAHIRELLDDCGLPADSYERYPHQFSGGQRQRIGIARALALKPKLIIADEPVSALDVSVQQQILDLMRHLQEKYSMAYLFISHDLRVVAQVCEKVLVMRQGELVESGFTKQVFAAPSHTYTKSLLAAVPGEADVALSA